MGSGNTGEFIDGMKYSVRPSPTEHMPIFDILPPAVRAALRDAPCDIDHTWVFREMRLGASAHAVVAAIEQLGRDFLAIAERDRANP